LISTPGAGLNCGHESECERERELEKSARRVGEQHVRGWALLPVRRQRRRRGGRSCRAFTLPSLGPVVKSMNEIWCAANTEGEYTRTDCLPACVVLLYTRHPVHPPPVRALPLFDKTKYSRSLALRSPAAVHMQMLLLTTAGPFSSHTLL
jgi:hypothetical protein